MFFRDKTWFLFAAVSTRQPKINPVNSRYSSRKQPLFCITFFPVKGRKQTVFSYILSPLLSVNGTPLQYSCLENHMDGGAWQAAVHGVAKSRTRLSDITFTFHFHALEKEMATHSSVLAWRILGTGEPGGLPSMGSHRVRHD